MPCCGPHLCTVQPSFATQQVLAGTHHSAAAAAAATFQHHVYNMG